MLSLQKVLEIKKIKTELEDLKTNKLDFINSIELKNENNFFEWLLSIKAPEDTPYSGGLFYLKIVFPDNYPHHRPEACFITPIYHTDVLGKKFDSFNEHLGHIFIPYLHFWKPENTMKQLLNNIYQIFYSGSADHPYDIEKNMEFMENKKLYEEKIKYFTKKYADSSKPFKEYDSNWDFSYDSK